MAFGQQGGPPASASQVRELLTLLNDAGHADFRAARGPIGFIDRLQEEEYSGASAVDVAGPVLSAAEQLMRRMPVDQLVVELRRRGWTVAKP
jgi:hypothetical protein